MHWPNCSLSLHKARLAGNTGAETNGGKAKIFTANYLLVVEGRDEPQGHHVMSHLLSSDAETVCELKGNGTSASCGFYSTAAISRGWERSMWRYGMRHRRSCNWEFYLEKCNPTAFRYCWYFWHPSSVLGFQSLLGDVKQNYFCIHFTFRITAVKPRMYEHCLFFTEAAS